jgi:hypothetical protein
MDMKFAPLVAALLLSGVAGCGYLPVGDTTQATRETSESIVGTIREIDRENRRFVLRIDSQVLTLRANEGVINFDQLEVGDRVRVEYFESTAVSLGAPGDLAEPVGGALTVLPPEGARPGALSLGTVTTAAEVVSYDRSRHVALLRFASGAIEPVAVPPEMRAFAAARQPGDRVVITYDVASAITVEPAS